MVFNYSPNGRDVLAVIMCFPMTLLTNYEYQNTKHASSFFFFDEFNQPCRMLMAASRSSSEFAQGKQWWCKSSHLPWLWCPIPGPCVTCGFTLFLVHFLAPMIFFLQFNSLPFHHRTRHFKILPQRSNTAKIQVSYWLQLLHITNYQFR